jgi:hypothetical protein
MSEALQSYLRRSNSVGFVASDDLHPSSDEQLCQLCPEGLLISDGIIGVGSQPNFLAVGRPESKVERLYPRELPDKVADGHQPFFIGLFERDIDR